MCIRPRPRRMDHSTDAPGARWPDLMVTVELSVPDSAKTFLLLPWYVNSKPIATLKDDGYESCFSLLELPT